MTGAVRVVTYNIWGRNTPADYWTRRGTVRGALPGSPAADLADRAAVWHRRRAMLLEVLVDADPDLVALQEVSAGLDGRSSQAEELAAGLSRPGSRFAVAETHHGLALLSRLPVRGRAERAIPSAPDAIGGHETILEVDIGSAVVWVVHLPVGPAAVKPGYATALRTAAATVDQPLLVCGDLNWAADSPAMAELLADGLLADGWVRGGGRPEALTMPLPAPVWRLDHVLYRPQDDWWPVSARLLGAAADTDGLFPSDHCGVTVELHQTN
jgi:endonuclease/exonuclease/phosphatase family metal-dependent hydrolase